MLATYLFTVCFNTLQYHTAFTILLPTDTSPSTPLKWKPSLIPTASSKYSTIEWKTGSQWLGAPYRIETAISKAQNVVHVWAGTFQAKEIVGNHFFEKWLDLHFEGAALHKTDSLTVLATYLFAVYFQYFTVSYSIYNIIAHWHLPFHSFKMKTQPHTHRF